jgi:hypothetical protein
VHIGRVMRQFSQDGLIRMDRGCIIIEDFAKLRNIAGCS